MSGKLTDVWYQDTPKWMNSHSKMEWRLGQNGGDGSAIPLRCRLSKLARALHSLMPDEHEYDASALQTLVQSLLSAQ